LPETNTPAYCPLKALKPTLMFLSSAGAHPQIEEFAERLSETYCPWKAFKPSLMLVSKVRANLQNSPAYCPLKALKLSLLCVGKAGAYPEI
jgi:hypothetical protein